MEQPKERKNWRNRAIVLIIVWILLLAVSLHLLDFLHTTFESNPQGQSVLSRTWAGYVVESDLDKNNEKLIKLNASWAAPGCAFPRQTRLLSMYRHWRKI